jgi:hypothetical protein
MKLKLTADVEGVLQLTDPSSSIIAERPPFTFELISDDKNQVNKAIVTMQLDEADSASSRLLSENGNIAVHYPPDAFRLTVEQLQVLESNLSFAFHESPIRRIRWDRPSINLIPENDSESSRVDTWNFVLTRSFPHQPCRIREAGFREMMTEAPRFESLAVLKAFIREGKNDFRDLRFVHAFYSFFFVIEGLFADGHSKKSKMLKAFSESKELRLATQITLNVLAKDNDTYQTFHKLFAGRQLTLDHNGVWTFLVNTRGQLHHYSLKSSQRVDTPFSQEQFEKPALLAMLLAGQSVCARIMTINEHFDER